MDFPPLDDARWDRLLGAVIGRRDQRPTVAGPDSPLAAPFPRLPADGEQDDEGWTIRLDSYA